MRSIFVKKDILQSHISDMQDIEARLEQIQSEVSSVRSSIRFQASSAGLIKSRLGQLASQIGEEKQKISNMSGAAASITDIYFRAEEDIKNQYVPRKDSGASSSGLTGAGAGAGYSGGGGGGRLGTEEKGSLWNEELSAAGTLLGIDFSGKARGDLLGYEHDEKAYAKWNFTKGDARASWEESLEGYLAKGSVESQLGIVSTKAEVTAVKGEAASGLYFELMKDGKIQPKIGGEVKASGNLLEGEVSSQIGTEDLNYHMKAKGDLVGGEAKASIGLGNVGTDEDGGAKYGVKAEAGVEVYAAKGEISGGFTLFGIDIDCKLTGKAGAAGVKAGGEITQSGVSIDAGLSALLGLEGEVRIDWSDFELPKFEWPKLKWR